MIKKILLIYTFFIFGNSYSQKKTSHPIGIGFLQVNTTYPIALYKNEYDKVPIHTIKFKIDKDGSTKFITKIKLKPYMMSVGDSNIEGENHKNMGLVRFSSILKFRVIVLTKTSFKVITNEDNGTSYFIKINKYSRNTRPINYDENWNVFETWERYLKRVQYIEKSNIKIYDKPNGKIICKNKNDDFIYFKVIELKGDWIKVKNNIIKESDSKNTKNCIGWTKWKDGNKLLIEITEQIYK